MKLVDDRVKLLIERMEAFPDEFTTGVSKWDSLMSRGVQFLNPIERFLIHKKWKKIQREAALHRVLSVLTEPTRDEIEREIVRRARLKVQKP
jgi:hypothetical protein